MTDKELLEYAAKAMKAAGDTQFTNYEVLDDSVCIELGTRRGANTYYWNPLTSDAQALRLAVKLGLHLFHSKNYVKCSRKTIGFAAEEIKGNDPYAATRRAIVRAAAEIGRQA